jgi:hypothetical protein
MCARKIFGNTFDIKIRNRAPQKGGSPVSIHYGDIINMIDDRQNTGLTDAQQRCEFTTGQGNVFIFN